MGVFAVQCLKPLKRLRASQRSKPRKRPAPFLHPVWLAALALFLFNLSVGGNLLVGNAVYPQQAQALPAPFDAHSLGLVFLLVLGLLFPALRRLCLGVAALASGATLMAVAPLYLVTGLTAGPSFALAALGGAGMGVVIMHIGRMLGVVPMERLVVVVPLACALSGAAGAVAAVQPQAFAALAFLASPLSAFFARRAFVGLAAEKGLDRSEGEGRVAPRFFLLGRPAFLRWSAAVLLTAGASQLCTGFVGLQLAQAAALAPPSLLALGALVALATGGLLALLLRLSRGIALACRLVLFASMAAVVGSLACAPASLPASYALALAGKLAFASLIYLVAPRISPLWLGQGEAGRQLAFLAGACAWLAGLAIACLLCRVEALGDAAPAVLLAGGAAASAGLLFAMPEEDLRLWTCGRQQLGQKLGDALEGVAEQFGLSDREAEVFALLAKGRDSRTIQKALNISSSTVSSHTQAIYKKTGLHSRQAVIDLVEGRCRARGR